MGTPAYMPPEQALGEIDRLDERCDVFSLGAILCEVLTGQPPYLGADGQATLRKARCNPTRRCEIVAASLWASSSCDARTICSVARPERNGAAAQTKGIMPALASPAPTPTMFCSAIKASVKRLGNFL